MLLTIRLTAPLAETEPEGHLTRTVFLFKSQSCALSKILFEITAQVSGITTLSQHLAQIMP